MQPPEQIGVLIAIPTKDSIVRMEWATNLGQLVTPMGCSKMTQIIPGREIAEARNIAAAVAIEKNAKYLFFLDDDVLPPNHTLTRFIEAMELNDDWDALTAIVPVKTPEATPCIFREGHPGPFWRWEFNTQFPIDLCGMACCMIRTEALQRMKQPWFEWIRGTDGSDYYEEGEDVGFCRRLRESGGTIIADGGVFCAHMDRTGTVYQISNKAPCFKTRKARKELKKFRPLVPA